MKWATWNMLKCSPVSIPQWPSSRMLSSSYTAMEVVMSTPARCIVQYRLQVYRGRGLPGCVPRVSRSRWLIDQRRVHHRSSGVYIQVKATTKWARAIQYAGAPSVAANEEGCYGEHISSTSRIHKAYRSVTPKISGLRSTRDLTDT